MRRTTFKKTWSTMALATAGAALAVMACTVAHAAGFSDLKVVQDAAQPGTWTISTTGTLPDGQPVPASKRTLCATRQDVLKSLDNPFMWNEKTGEEDKTCPTSLTTNTATLGVATMSCPAQTIDLPGQKLSVPGMAISTEFKRTGKDTWTIKTGGVTTDLTYHGSATAACLAKR